MRARGKINATKNLVIFLALFWASTSASAALPWADTFADTAPYYPSVGNGIKWRVLNNFRVLASEDEQQRYFRDRAAYFARSGLRCWLGTLSTWPRCLGMDATIEATTPPTLKNYLTTWEPDKANYKYGWANDPNRTIEVIFATPGQRFGCRWSIDGKVLVESTCKQKIQTTLGVHVLTVRASDGKKSLNAQARLEIKDTLVLALGDSYGSGEGAPTVLKSSHGPAEWLDQRCHNSLLSGFASAASRLALLHPHRSITFLSYACSGSTIDHGILAPYYGVENIRQVTQKYAEYETKPPANSYFAEDAIPSQLQRAREALCIKPTQAGHDCTGEIRPPDYVLISTGGNEFGFGPITTDLISGPLCHGDCTKDIQSMLERGTKTLPGLYDQLAKQLSALRPKSVILTQYPVPIKDEAGNYCSDRLWAVRPTFLPRYLVWLSWFGVGVSDRKSEYAYQKVIQTLDPIMRAAAIRDHWHFVSGIADASRTRGYCSKRRWYQDIGSAYAAQGGQPGIVPTTTGAMHPNTWGYSMMGNAILPLLQSR